MPLIAMASASVAPGNLVVRMTTRMSGPFDGGFVVLLGNTLPVLVKAAGFSEGIRMRLEMPKAVRLFRRLRPHASEAANIGR